MGVIELCAVVFQPDIECPIKFPFEVLLNTSDGSAGKLYCAGLNPCMFLFFSQLKQWITGNLMRY